jgi:hypothetical protein
MATTALAHEETGSPAADLAARHGLRIAGKRPGALTYRRQVWQYPQFITAHANAKLAAAFTTARLGVLLIDEALVTGDARFRRRGEQRVRRPREDAGKVFLVSHPIGSIRDTCERTIWLESGMVRADGPTGDVIKEYEAYMSR